MRTEYEIMNTFQQLLTLNRRKNTRILQQNNPTALTDMQIIALDYILVEAPQRDVFAKDLEGFFDIKPSSVSSLVGYLEQAGYIRREPLPDDRRMLRLIPTGKALAIRPWLLDAIDHSIVDGLGGLSEEEMQALLVLMNKMVLSFRYAAETGKPMSQAEEA